MTASRGTWLLAFFALVAAAAPASAQRGGGNKIHGVRFDVHLDITHFGGFGAGFRADVPIVPQGLIRGANDELAISPGVDIFFADGHHHGGGGDHDNLGIAIPIPLQWNFYLSDQFSIFPELGLGIYFGNYGHKHHHHKNGEHHTEVGVDLVAGFGARLHFNSRNALLVRVAWPSGLQIGITF